MTLECRLRLREILEFGGIKLFAKAEVFLHVEMVRVHSKKNQRTGANVSFGEPVEDLEKVWGGFGASQGAGNSGRAGSKGALTGLRFGCDFLGSPKDYSMCWNVFG